MADQKEDLRIKKRLVALKRGEFIGLRIKTPCRLLFILSALVKLVLTS